MRSLKSSVLILGRETPKTRDLGALCVGDVSALESYLSSLSPGESPAVIVLDLQYLSGAADASWLVRFKIQRPKTQIILITGSYGAEVLKTFINTGHVFKILSGFEDVYFAISVQEAMAAFDLIDQTAHLSRLSEEQNLKLLDLQKELEDRVVKRQQTLTESREKLLRANRRNESFHRAVVAIQKAQSVKEIERLVADALFPALQIAWVRISFVSAKSPPTELGFYSLPLVWDGIVSGYASFGRKENFSAAEQNFLDQLSSAIGLAIDRLAKFDQAEFLKQQWESTFDAITQPVAIIDPNFNLVRTNQTFSLFSKTPLADLNGRKCYASLFGRTLPCEGCQLGERFELAPAQTRDGEERILSVSSQKFEDEESKAFINIYRDTTEKKQVERRILESAKLAELGTVGGSIAHELNNPIAGMLTFAQLIRMDLKGDEWFHEDILEIEKGILRCRDIIQDLLSSIRRIATQPVKSSEDGLIVNTPEVRK